MRPLYVGSATRVPLEFIMYPMALMMSGLWCFGLLCLGRILLGMMVGYVVFNLSFRIPSCVASIECRVWSSCVVIVSKSVCVFKFFTGLFSKSTLRIGHLPPLCVWRSSCNSLNVLLCLEVLILGLYLHPPNRCVLVSVRLHFLHNIGPMLCFRIHRYTCVPHATSYESRRHMYEDWECVCMLSYVPVSLAFLSRSPKTPLVVVCFVSFIAFLCQSLYLLAL